MRRIGILGGTFDPVHNGHLLLGEQAYREYGLDEIWFMPCGHPPHKKSRLVTQGKEREDMVKLAIASVSYFVYSDFELKREGNTYTAQTLTLLREAYPQHEFYFIIGADSGALKRGISGYRGLFYHRGRFPVPAGILVSSGTGDGAGCASGIRKNLRGRWCAA